MFNPHEKMGILNLAPLSLGVVTESFSSLIPPFYFILKVILSLSIEKMSFSFS
jgi:hypothetical protein